MPHQPLLAVPGCRAGLMFSPLLYIFFSLEISVPTSSSSAPTRSHYLVSSYAMQSYLYGRGGAGPWVSELYEYVQSVMLFGSLVSVARNPRKPNLQRHRQGPDARQERMSPIAQPYFAIFFILLVAAIYSGLALHDRTAGGRTPDDRGRLEPHQSRSGGRCPLGWWPSAANAVRNQRLSVRRHALMRTASGLHSVLIHDASSGGVSVEFIDEAPRLARRRASQRGA